MDNIIMKFELNIIINKNNNEVPELEISNISKNKQNINFYTSPNNSLDNFFDSKNNKLNKEFDITNNCHIINIYGEESSIIEYLKNNPIIKNKKIIIHKNYNLNDYKYLKKLYKDYQNIYFYLKENKEPINIIDYEKTYSIINNIVEKVKKLNLSQLEQIMYVYDIVRDKRYNKESVCESSSISRDLTSVLLTDKIVCVGYAKILEQILLQLGIKVKKYNLNSLIYDKPGHVRNIIYVNDEKYHINGIYFFDPTFDSRAKEDNSYLNTYRYFAKTKEEIDNYYPKYQDYIFDTINEVENLLITNNLEKIDIAKIMIINDIFKIIDNNPLIDEMLNIPLPSNKFKEEFNKEKTLIQIKRLKKLFNNPISFDTLIEVLYNVRKIEYYENSPKYPFDLKTLSLIAYNSHWLLEENINEHFLNATFNKVPYMAKNFQNRIEEYSNKTDLEKRVNQIRLTKTLTKIKNR